MQAAGRIAVSYGEIIRGLQMGASLTLTQLDSALIRIMGIVGIVEGEKCVARAMARCNQRQQSLLADASCISDMPLQLW